MHSRKFLFVCPAQSSGQLSIFYTRVAHATWNKNRHTLCWHKKIKAWEFGRDANGKRFVTTKCFFVLMCSRISCYYINTHSGQKCRCTYVKYKSRGNHFIRYGARKCLGAKRLQQCSLYLWKSASFVQGLKR